MSEKVKRTLLTILLVFVVIIALPLLFPLFIGGTVASFFKKVQSREQYEAFIKACNGLSFFCYTNEKTARVFIERHIIDRLDPDLNIILLTDHEPVCEFDKRSITMMLTQTGSQGYPKLIHIKDGEVKAVSLQDALMGILDGKSDPDTFLHILREQRSALMRSSST